MCAPKPQQSQDADHAVSLRDMQDIRAERARHAAATTSHFDRDAAYFQRQYESMVERGEAWPFPSGGSYGFLG